MKKLINIVSHIIFGAVLLVAGASAQADDGLIQNEIDNLLTVVLTETRLELAVPHIVLVDGSLQLSQISLNESSQLALQQAEAE
ncbi:MAG: hypothetical protein ACFHVJ_17600 [Aestuariibacter sp.]